MATTRVWMKFFMEAGIPKDSAVQYAVSFEENRMDMNMLMDLDKEYLRDLKITALGDIISILKQAKIQHERLTSDRVLNPDHGNISPSIIERNQSKGTEKAPLPSKPFLSGEKLRLSDVSSKEDETGQNIHKRLGPLVVKIKEEASSSVFSRLGDQEDEEEVVSPGEKITKSVCLEGFRTSSTTSRTEPIVKTGSIFGRLGPEKKEVTQQESQVSSSSDSHSHGILKTKQIGIGKTKTLTPLGPGTKKLPIAKRLGNQTNIISLKKAPVKETERKRVSFGENQVRNMTTGVVSTMAAEQGHKSTANILDLRNKLDHENKQTKVTTGGSKLTTKSSTSPANLVIKTRPSPITPPSTATSAAATSARIKTPLEATTKVSTITSGGVKARVGISGGTMTSTATSGGVKTPAATTRIPVTPPGVPVRTTVHLNPKMIKLQPPQTASTSSAGILAKTSVKNRVGEKDLQVKLTGEGMKRTVAQAEPPVKTAIKRTFNSEEEQKNEKEETGAKPKKKRLVMIKTKADGTKTRQVISEDDPILQKVTVTKLRKTSSPSSVGSSSSKKSFTEVEDATPSASRRPQSDDDVVPVKDDFTIRIRPTTSSSHRTLAGKAMELAVRDEKRAFQGGGLGDSAFLTLANRAKAASLSREVSIDKEADLLPRRNSDPRMRRMSLEDDKIRMSVEDERSRRMAMENERMRRLSMEAERIHSLVMENAAEDERTRRMEFGEDNEWRHRERMAEEGERMRRLAEEEQRSLRMAEEDERARKMAVEDHRYEMEDAGRGRVFQRLGGRQRY